jgi:hypothetical protein
MHDVRRKAGEAAQRQQVGMEVEAARGLVCNERGRGELADRDRAAIRQQGMPAGNATINGSA